MVFWRRSTHASYSKPNSFDRIDSAQLSLARERTDSPPSDSTAPSAASSPSQREATASHAVEAPTTNGTTPASASSPHQQQVTSGAKSGVSTSDITAYCSELLLNLISHAYTVLLRHWIM